MIIILKQKKYYKERYFETESVYFLQRRNPTKVTLKIRCEKLLEQLLGAIFAYASLIPAQATIFACASKCKKNK